MKRQNVRVLLASENPGTRSILRRIVETEDKTVIIGEAENGSRALNLARSLRPDVMLIDSSLPSVVGLDNIPLSRVGGLDVAQSISEEIPNMRVILLNSLNDRLPLDSVWRAEANALLCRDSKDTCIPFTLGELGEEPLHVVEHRGPLRVPRHEHTLPGRERSVELHPQRADEVVDGAGGAGAVRGRHGPRRVGRAQARHSRRSKAAHGVLRVSWEAQPHGTPGLRDHRARSTGTRRRSRAARTC